VSKRKLGVIHRVLCSVDAVIGILKSALNTASSASTTLPHS
jgi:hypothetical protein